jgi:cardiolipin synthase
MQVVASGPDVDLDPLYDAIVTASFQAKKRIWMATPYFVPTEALNLALILAARRGVDVRIIVPRKSDHRFVDLSGRSYLRDIEAAGGRVLHYQPSMLHAKVSVFDDSCAIVGSANMDIRSLFLNYEIALMIYSKEQVDLLAAWVEGLFDYSKYGLKPPTKRRLWMENLARILSPLA